MSLAKLFVYGTCLLFLAIGVAIVVKKNKSNSSVALAMPQEVVLEQELLVVPEVLSLPEPIERVEKIVSAIPLSAMKEENQEEMDRVEEFFNKGEPKFPIVETIVYKSRTPWQNGRPAWLSDYSSHYSTSRHFIARSLNGKRDYFKQDIKEGDQFNVFKKDKNIEFYLLVDVIQCKMRFYYIDLDTKEKTLIKSYPVGLGRIDSSKGSGLLTPLGTFTLGDRVKVYRPKAMDFHNGHKIEMIQVFGSRWIPFDKEVKGCTDPAKGLGIHGLPLSLNGEGELVEDLTSLGKHESDGCIRLATQDMEELFAIIITKPTTIELVKNIKDAQFY